MCNLRKRLVFYCIWPLRHYCFYDEKNYHRDAATSICWWERGSHRDTNGSFEATATHVLFLTVVAFMSFRRSGISDLLGLWAELTIGLEGVGMFRDPMVLVLGLRTDSRSSLSPTPSLTPLGLRLGCVEVETPGPPDTWDTDYHELRRFIFLKHFRVLSKLAT